MKKQDQIDELKKALTDANLKLIEQTMKTAAREAKETREATAATLRQIRGGSVPIAVLRDMVRADYEVEQSRSEKITTIRLRVIDHRPVEKALADALLAPEKPKFATGGYLGQGSITLSPHDRELFKRMGETNHYFNGGKTA